MKTLAVIVFLTMYLCVIVFQRFRVYAVVAAGAIFMLVGIITPGQALEAINWNILMMIMGTMVLVHYFIESKMPSRLADVFLNKSKNLLWVTIYMSLFAGFISAFIDNVATVLMVAPVGIAICRKMNVSPVGMTLSIAVSSNLQGAATLVGDTTSMMLGAYAHMDFLSFFWFHGKPGIFFAVELGAIATVPIMMILFRKMKEPTEVNELTEVRTRIPTAMLLLMVATLIMASFIDNKPETTNGMICMGYAVLMMVIDIIIEHDGDNAVVALKSIDFELLILLIGLFTAIAGVTKVGIIDDLAAFIVKTGGNNIFLLFTVIVWGSVLISAFVDNIPYVATMLPVLLGVTQTMNVDPTLLYFGLLTGATLGGNLTPIGASANITAVGMLRREGHPVTFVEFMKIGVPFTLTAVMVGYLFIWFVWS
jgi:Na+/H+ antiporter NhaD/arsenite permease-like protein